MTMRSFIVDTDTASDDAVALVLAARDPSVARGQIPREGLTTWVILSRGLHQGKAPWHRAFQEDYHEDELDT